MNTDPTTRFEIAASRTALNAQIKSLTAAKNDALAGKDRKSAKKIRRQIRSCRAALAELPAAKPRAARKAAPAPTE